MNMTGSHGILNRQICNSEELSQELQNWLGSNDVIYRSRWRASGTRIPFYDLQYQKLKNDLKPLGSDLEYHFPAKQLHRLLLNLIQKERLFKGIQISFSFRIPQEIPKENQSLIQLSQISQEAFQLNSKGLILGIREGLKYPGKEFMSLLDWNHPLRRRWLLEASNQDCDQFCLQDDKGKLIEGIQGILYLVKAKKIYTPHLDTGATEWAIRSKIAQLGTQLGFQIIETSDLQVGHLHQAEELFLADDFNGIQWVMGFETKRYFKKTSQVLIDQINQEWLLGN